MLRVCGVTFDHTTNYGSCLQAYALQRVIEEMSIAGEKCSYQLIPRALFPPRAPKPTSLKTKIKRVIKAKLTAYRRKRFIGFEDRYMHYAKCRNREELPGLNAETDAFVCGSDVIWNLSFTQGDPLYFLDFAQKYRFSYAASFGKADIHYEFDNIRLDEKEERIYEKYLPKLNAISVREANAVDIAAQYTENEVKQVCDPVLLLTAEEWNQIIRPDKTRDRYIFAYNTSVKNNFTNVLKRLQNETGLKVIHVVWEIKDAIKEKSLFFPDPQKWLFLLKNAEYVITNSFHATVFATIFHKKFFAVMQDGKDARTNVRIYDYLERIGLEDRIINNPAVNIVKDLPDYTDAEQKIGVFRDESMRFLQENLEAAEREKQAREKGASVGS